MPNFHLIRYMVLDLFLQYHHQSLTRELVKIKHKLQFNNKLATFIKYIDIIKIQNVIENLTKVH